MTVKTNHSQIQSNWMNIKKNISSRKVFHGSNAAHQDFRASDDWSITEKSVNIEKGNHLAVAVNIYT